MEKTVFAAADIPFPEGDALRDDCESEVMVSPVAGHEVTLIPAPIVPIRNGAYMRQLAAWAGEKGADIRTGHSVLGPVIETGAIRVSSRPRRTTVVRSPSCTSSVFPVH